MKKEFVPHELALTLKEKGFDEPCLRGYNSAYTENNKPVLHDFVYGELQTNTMYEKCRLADVNVCTAPLWQQVIDWLREKHSIDVMIRQITLDGTAYYKITKIETDDKIKGYSNFCKSTYEAKEKAIKQALTLI
jgi:hypothetical protein